MPRITAPAKQNIGKMLSLTVDYFRGVDTTSQTSAIIKSRSPNALNMIRSVPGLVKKRYGWYELHDYEAAINGIYFIDDEVIIHAGTALYKHDNEEPTLLYSSMSNTKSTAQQLNGKLWILDGSHYVVYGLFSGTAKEVKTVPSIAYVPTITIARGPTGGGTTFEPVNLLTGKFKDSFIGTANATEYQLSLSSLTAATVAVKVMNSSGEWVTKTEGTDFTVDRTDGVVTFSTAPGVPPITGKDNIEVEAVATDDGNLSKITSCRISTIYGVNGAADRLFVSGDPSNKNKDYYSQYNDPTYFGDTWFSVIGHDGSAIVGYSIIENHLATHKANDPENRNVYLRDGSLNTDDEAEFLNIGIIQGPGAIAAKTFGHAAEPLYLTAEGICSTTPYELNSRYYTANRSALINTTLRAESGLENASACVFKDFYVLSVNGKAYILDTLSKTDAEASERTFGYECYLWDNVDAHIMAASDDRLYFGTEDGQLRVFYNDADNASGINCYTDNDYNSVDNDNAVQARWDVFINGDAFYRSKDVALLVVRLAPEVRTGCDIYYVNNNDVPISLYQLSAARFSFSHVIFSRMVFGGESAPKDIILTPSIPLQKTLKLSLQNNRAEPFCFYSVALEFREI